MKDLNYYLEFTEKKDNGCMEWTRCLNTDGYPRAVIRGNSNGKVHREVCALKEERGISGYVVRHTCDNPRCINPDHLILGSVLDNVRDRSTRKRAHGHVSVKEAETVKALRVAGFTYKEISATLGIKYKRVEYIVKHKLNL